MKGNRQILEMSISILSFDLLVEGSMGNNNIEVGCPFLSNSWFQCGASGMYSTDTLKSMLQKRVHVRVIIRQDHTNREKRFVACVCLSVCECRCVSVVGVYVLRVFCVCLYRSVFVFEFKRKAKSSLVLRVYSTVYEAQRQASCGTL